MRQRLHRRHGCRHRRDEAATDSGSGGADQHDLVAILVGRNLAGIDIEERIHRECRLPGLVAIEIGQHAALRIGSDAQLAQPQFAGGALQADVAALQIQAASSQRQRQRRIAVAEILQRQRLVPDCAIGFVRCLQQHANPGCSRAQRLNRIQRAQ